MGVGAGAGAGPGASSGTGAEAGAEAGAGLRTDGEGANVLRGKETGLAPAFITSLTDEMSPCIGSGQEGSEQKSSFNSMCSAEVH